MNENHELKQAEMNNVLTSGLLEAKKAEPLHRV